MVATKRILPIIFAVTISILLMRCSICTKKKIPPPAPAARAIHQPAKNLAPGVSLAHFTITNVKKNKGNTVLFCRMKIVHKTGPATQHISAGTHFTVIVPKASFTNKKGYFKKNKTIYAKIRRIPPGMNVKSGLQYEIISINTVE